MHNILSLAIQIRITYIKCSFEWTVIGKLILLQAMSYASPKALMNAVLGLFQPSIASGTGIWLVVSFYFDASHIMLN